MEKSQSVWICFQLFMKEVMIPETLIHISKGINTWNWPLESFANQTFTIFPTYLGSRPVFDHEKAAKLLNVIPKQGVAVKDLLKIIHFLGNSELNWVLRNLFPANYVRENSKGHHPKHHGDEINGLRVKVWFWWRCHIILILWSIDTFKVLMGCDTIVILSAKCYKLWINLGNEKVIRINWAIKELPGQ